MSFCLHTTRVKMKATFSFSPFRIIDRQKFQFHLVRPMPVDDLV